MKWDTGWFDIGWFDLIILACGGTTVVVSWALAYALAGLGYPVIGGMLIVFPIPMVVVVLEPHRYFRRLPRWRSVLTWLVYIAIVGAGLGAYFAFGGWTMVVTLTVLCVLFVAYLVYTRRYVGVLQRAGGMLPFRSRVSSGEDPDPESA